ncbi:MAG TPA: HPr family phosphocarrier protein [Labilithrix sp.]
MSGEAREHFTIVNDLGLHARAATKLVQLASKFPCDVHLSHQGQTANAKSVMGVLLLCGSKGSTVEVVAKGDRAQECVAAIGELIKSRFGEPS